MAAGRIKGITIEIGGDTTRLTKALASVDNALGKTKSNLRDLNNALKLNPGNTELLKDKQQELAHAISEAKSKLDTEKEAYRQLAQADKTPENIEKMRQLKVQIDLDTVALEELEKQAKESASILGSQMQAAGAKIQEVGNKIKSIGDSISRVGQKITTSVTMPIVGAFGASAKAAIDWESAFTGVMKTVDETANTTYDDLKDSINEIAKTTASSQNQIAATMEIAGQLGVSADDITEFTRTMVMLGDTTNLSSEEAASAIAKFANVTGMSLSNVDKLGSAIVDLGNNYATTEADIMSMATRLSGAGAQIGLSQGEILGFATALSSVGIEAEMGGSAFSKAMIKMQVAAETGYDQVIDLQNKTGMSLRELQLLSSNNSKDFKALADSLGLTKEEMNATIKAGANLQDFAEVANMETKEFVELYRNDAPAALQAFIKGLGDTEGHGESTIAMLQEMGFTEVRLRDTLTRLANSGDLVTDAVARGNQAWGENSAMTAEAEKRYATMAAKISQLKARITEVAVEIGETLMPYFEKAMTFIEDLTERWKALDDEQKEAILKFAAIAAALGPVLVIVGNLVGAIGTIVSVGGQLVTFVGGLIAKIGGLQGIITALTGPVGIVIAAIGALTAAFIYFYNTNEEFRNRVNAVFEQVKTFIGEFVEQVKVWFQDFLAFCQPIFEQFQALGTALGEFFQALIPVVLALFDQIKAAVTQFLAEHQAEINFALTFIREEVMAAFDIIRTYIKTVLDVITNVVRAFTSILKGDWSGALNFLKAAAESAKNGVVSIFKRLGEMLKNIFGDIVNKMKQWGHDMIDSLVQGIKDKIEAVKNVVGEVAGAIAEFLHFSEPDVGPLSNFHTYAPDMMKLFSEGIRDNAHLITDAIGSSFDLRPYFTSMNNGINRLTNVASNNMNAQSQQGPVVVNVSLEGDANRLFRVLSEEAHRDWQITGQSRLMGY